MTQWLQRKADLACTRMLFALLALFALLFGGKAVAEADGTLRVRLLRLGAPSEITLQADCDYDLSEGDGPTLPAGTPLTVSADADVLTLRARGDVLATGESLHLTRRGTGAQGLSFLSPALSNRFCGDLTLTASGGVVTALLHIDIEDYLCGVVGCEMPPTGGLEALKAQAVVARNCALKQKSARSGAGYDLADSGDVLSFRGYNASAEYADVERAVDQTRGQVLYWGDSPAICYFCDSNGGQTESSANAYGTPLAYSVVMDDTYDLSAGPSNAATLRRDGSDLLPALKEALLEGAAQYLGRQGVLCDPADIAITAIEDIACASPRYAEPSRLYRALAFTLDLRVGQSEARAVVNVPTYGGIEEWYDLSLGEEDNETVWVTGSERSFEITFRRSGSGVGLSRRGAQAMARKGLPYETILDYYYPGTTLKTVEFAGSAQTFDGSADDLQPIATARLSQRARLYGSADDQSAVLSTLPAGATLQVYGVRGEWAAVGSGGLYGYTHAGALTAFALAGAVAAQVQDETWALIQADSVEVLQLPVETALALETLSGGDSVRLDAYTDRWALVTTQAGTEGFILRDTLTLQGADDEGGEQIVAAEEGLYGLLTEDAELYVNADDSVSPRGTLQKGEYVQILAYSRTWAHVTRAGGESGYVKLNHLSAVRRAPSEYEGGEVTVVRGKQYLYVLKDDLPLYAGPSADQPVLATLKLGQRVRLGAYNSLWACVRMDGITGYAPLEGLSEQGPEADATAPEGGEIVLVEGEVYISVAEDGAPLYPSWDASGEPLSLLPAGTQVQLGAYNSLWACVRVEGVTGFMRMDTLTDINHTVEAP